MDLEEKKSVVRRLKGYRNSMTEFKPEEMDYLISLIEDTIGYVEPYGSSDEPILRSSEWSKKVKEVLIEELQSKPHRGKFEIAQEEKYNSLLKQTKRSSLGAPTILKYPREGG